MICQLMWFQMDGKRRQNSEQSVAIIVKREADFCIKFGCGFIKGVSIYQMQRGQYLKRGQLPPPQPYCIICQLQLTTSPSMPQISAKILSTKYKSTPPQPNQSTIIDHILNPRPSSHAISVYRQAQQQANQLEMLKQYHNFHNITQIIKPLVLERNQKDRNIPIHLDSKAYQTTMRRLLSQKVKTYRQPKFKHILTKNGSGTSTDEEFYSSPSKYKNLVKKTQQGLRSPETKEIRRLTRNLSNMVRTFQDKLEFHPSLIFDLMSSVPGHALDLTQIEKQHRFEREIEGNISIIVNKRPIERLKTDFPLERIEDNYGLPAKGCTAQSRKLIKTSRQGFKKQSHNKSQSKGLKENLSPNLRVQTDYDCQVIKKQKRKSKSTKQLKVASPSLKSLSKTKFSKLGSRSQLTNK